MPAREVEYLRARVKTLMNAFSRLLYKAKDGLWYVSQNEQDIDRAAAAFMAEERTSTEDVQAGLQVLEEIKELRADKQRLDWLLKKGFWNWRAEPGNEREEIDRAMKAEGK